LELSLQNLTCIFYFVEVYVGNLALQNLNFVMTLMDHLQDGEKIVFALVYSLDLFSRQKM